MRLPNVAESDIKKAMSRALFSKNCTNFVLFSFGKNIARIKTMISKSAKIVSDEKNIFIKEINDCIFNL